jgi:hypothetical protein
VLKQAEPLRAGGGRDVGPAGSTPRAPTPGVTSMATAKAPPFLLPGEHFAAGLVFLLLGSVGLVVVARDLAAGFYLSPRVIGVAHLFTLGWITTSIMASLYQFLPVALAEPIRSVRLAHVTFVLYVPGLAVFVAGLVTGVTGVMVAGAAVFGSGVLLFVGNLGATLARSGQRDVTWWALAWAAVFLVVTLATGWALAGNLRWGYLAEVRLTVIGVHLHVAIAGWVLLVMVGVAHRLLPMFLLSHGVGDGFARWSVGLLAAGVSVLAVFHHGPPLVSRWLPAVLVAAGLVCFLAQAWRFYRGRHRPVLDPGMRLAALGLVLLGTGLVFAAPVLAGVASARVATAYVLAVLLGISLFVAAHYYKIVPFLVWFHRFGPQAGKGPVPRVSELYSARAASLAGVLLAAGSGTLVAAVALGLGGVARLGAAVLAAGVAVVFLQMLKLGGARP